MFRDSNFKLTEVKKKKQKQKRIYYNKPQLAFTSTVYVERYTYYHCIICITIYNHLLNNMICIYITYTYTIRAI